MRDQLQRDFVASRPNEKWVADITYIRTERLRLSRLHRRLPQPDDRRLAARNAPAHRLGARRAGDGERSAPTGSGLDRAHRPRLPVHEHPRASATPTDSTNSALRPRWARRATPTTTRWPEAWVATMKSEFVDGRRFPSYEHAEHEVLHLDRLLQRGAAPRRAR